MMINGEIFVIPTWVIILLALSNVIYRAYIVVNYPVTILSRIENLLYLIALINVCIFYAGIWADIWTTEITIALSRFVWGWLLIVSLYISHRMAKRNGVT